MIVLLTFRRRRGGVGVPCHFQVSCTCRYTPHFFGFFFLIRHQALGMLAHDGAAFVFSRTRQGTNVYGACETKRDQTLTTNATPRQSTIPNLIPSNRCYPPARPQIPSCPMARALPLMLLLLLQTPKNKVMPTAPMDRSPSASRPSRRCTLWRGA